MKVCGIICEYDPFHNGHAYHIQWIRAHTACDYIVCAMSGYFTQRGQPAILSKWARAEMALRCGADAVFELPTLFAVRDAQRFAHGAVALLNALGAVNQLGFGSETGDLHALQVLASTKENSQLVREGLQRGETLARARAASLKLPNDTPNDILAIEYLRALQVTHSGMEPVTVKRYGSGYHDDALGSHASATAIRKAIRNGVDIHCAMPEAAYRILMNITAKGAVQKPEGLDSILLYLLRTIDAAQLSQIADITEGLENSILHAAQTATSRTVLLHTVKSKRYTYARLSRVVLQALLGMTKALTEQYPLPTYARLLGFRKEAQPLLSTICKTSQIPIVTRAAKYRHEHNAAFALDLRAGNLWTLGLVDEQQRAGCPDLTQSVIIL